MHEDDVVNKLPSMLQHQESPSVVYSLSNTIHSKLFNYKDTVKSIDTNNTETHGTGIATCDCRNSEFVDEHHGHIVTGDLRIIQNQKIRKLISKGPNYREPRTINWNKCRYNISQGLAECASRMASSCKDIRVEDMLPWQNIILERVDANIIIKTENQTS